MDILEAIIYAEDLNEMRTFYTNLLGRPPVIDEPGHHIFYQLDSTMLLIFNPRESMQHHLTDEFPIPTHGARGEGHVAMQCPARELDQWRGHLARLGVPVETEIHWPHGATSIYFRDPAHNSIEIATPSLWHFKE